LKFGSRLIKPARALGSLLVRQLPRIPVERGKQGLTRNIGYPAQSSIFASVVLDEVFDECRPHNTRMTLAGVNHELEINAKETAKSL
jgi:hypothetical protein